MLWWDDKNVWEKLGRDGSEDHLVGEKNGLSLSEVKLNAQVK